MSKTPKQLLKYKEAVAKSLCGEDTFLKKVIFPAPHLPKTLSGIAFIVADKSNSNFLFYLLKIKI